MSEINFSVRGSPVAQGSVRAYVRGGRAIVVAKGHGALADWRHDISAGARTAMADLPSFSGAVVVHANFAYTRPPSHFRSDGVKIKAGAPRYPRLDIDKTARALLDALTGVAIDDDSQVVELMVNKVWDDFERGWQGVRVRVREIES